LSALSLAIPKFAGTLNSLFLLSFTVTVSVVDNTLVSLADVLFTP